MSEVNNTWSEIVILVDCTFVDALLKDFTVNFSRMIGRPLDKADLCHWLDCLLLDAGVNEGEHQTFAVFIHAKKSKGMPQMNPGQFEQLNGQAFKDQLGEFVMSCYPVEEITTTSEFMTESVRAAMEAPDVKQILVVGDMLTYGDALKKAIIDTEKGLSQSEKPVSKKKITLFTMNPTGSTESYNEVILGYSVMSALGIRGNEL